MFKKVNDMIENYIFRNEKEPYNFEAKDGKVYLRQYQPFLVFYSSFGSDKAEYCIDDNSAIYDKAPELLSGGRFGAYLKLSDKYSFNGKNILPLNDSGRISFWLKAENKHQKHKVAIKLKQESIPAGEYSFKISVRDNISQDVLLSFKKDATTKDIANKCSFLMDPSVFFCESSYDEERNALVISTINKKESLFFHTYYNN